jgi:hypothetical protein
MKLTYLLSAGLIALPIVSCLPVAVADVKVAREDDTPSIFGYLYKKREAEDDTPSIFGYLYKKREEADDNTPSIFGYLYHKRKAEEDAPNVFEYGTYKP